MTSEAPRRSRKQAPPPGPAQNAVKYSMCSHSETVMR